jgi:serine/threonine-protein kinase
MIAGVNAPVTTEAPRGPDDLRYCLHDEIAAGGMGTVHLGRRLGEGGFSQLVAIKRLHGHLGQNEELGALLLEEARIAARVRHPNVVQALDVTRRGEELWLVMEYVEGEPLHRVFRAAIDRGEAVPVPVAVGVVVAILGGLHAAHEARSESGEPLEIVHRDVSPQNILIGIDGVPRLIDFGVARAATRVALAGAGVARGKLGYMAPEQLRGGPVDRRADVYAAGIILWELLTGRRLFSGDDHLALVCRVAEAQVDPPDLFRTDLPAPLVALLRRSLARDRADRPPTAEAFALALEDCVAPARPREIARWLAALAGPQLAEKARRREEVESLEGLWPAPDPSPAPLRGLPAATLLREGPGLDLGAFDLLGPLPLPDAPRPARGRVVAAVGGALALALAGIAWLYRNG